MSYNRKHQNNEPLEGINELAQLDLETQQLLKQKGDLTEADIERLVDRSEEREEKRYQRMVDQRK